VRITRGGLSICLVLPVSRGIGKGRQKSAEGIVGLFDRTEGPNLKYGKESQVSMHSGDAEGRVERPGAGLPGSGRKSREGRAGASRGTARRGHSGPETVQLMEAVVERENMFAAWKPVKANRGAAGVDGMTVAALLPYLQEHWPQIKEELLAGRYEPSPVRLVEIPKPGGGLRPLGIRPAGRPARLVRLCEEQMK